MLRRIVRIDEEKCNGCGACARACHEGAIAMVNGKAHLMREDYCDGLGDCLPACPADAISFEEREAAPYNEGAVRAHKEGVSRPADGEEAPSEQASRLTNWPVQLRLAPLQAPYYEDASLLVAADCTAFACGCAHERFLKGRVTLIGCPKLDPVDYAEKLGQILLMNRVRDVTVLRMTVPCCGGLASAVKRAVEFSGRDIPCRVVVVSPNGSLQE